jgi:hypothetical protein
VIRAVAAPGMFANVSAHLDRAEEVGFFLAEWKPDERCFSLIEWRPIGPEGYAQQTDYPVSLTDEVRAEVIKWAWDSGLSLVEVHSHGLWTPAAFSGSDLHGFGEWVQHLWWRLQGRPYAALVTAEDTFDGWAWLETPDRAEQIDALEVEGETLTATAETFSRLALYEHRQERRSA